MRHNELLRRSRRVAPRWRDNPSRWPAEVLLIGVLALGASGCVSAGRTARPGASEGDPARSAALAGLNATLWVQSAVEYRALARQAYATAGRALERGLQDPAWTAALEQTAGFEGLPPAVVLDVDETVLDNGDYQGRLLEDGESYASDTWAAWVAEEAADPVPGALEFTRTAARAGVAVFYVTNRDAPLEADTRANLERLGFPLAGDGADAVLTRGERPEWGSNKSSRRAHVARSHRIVLLVGDDLGDFVEADETPGAREAAFERHGSRWGERWIVLPNPMYGSWERALLEAAREGDPVAAKLDRLETGRAGEDGRAPPR